MVTQGQLAKATTHMPRRAVLAGLFRSAALLLLSPSTGCARAAPKPADDDALLTRIMAGIRPHVSRRLIPYRITRTLPIAAGTIVTIDPGTRIVWAGPTPVNGIVGVFEAIGDDTGIIVVDGEAFVECETPSPTVYAALMRGRCGFSISGLRAKECGHVCIQGSSEDYRAILTTGVNANIARDVRITGGGASFAALQTQGQGACLLAYVVGARVADVTYENVPHGIQWWGGDAGTEPWQNGARTNERKCMDVIIERATVRRAHMGGIWGSMGRGIAVRDCVVEECGDVGFDAEGCTDTTFEHCHARNGHNGCFATFSLCNDVRFVNCRGIVDRANYPLFRLYNKTQSNADNRGIAIIGGRFECRDSADPGTMDSAMGPAQDVSITGARLVNVRIDLAFYNMHRTLVADNVLDFPFPLPSVAAIRTGSSKSITGASVSLAGGATVRANTIRYAASRSRGRPVAIEVREDDFNSNAVDLVADNVVTGPFATGVRVINATTNIGIVPVFDVRGNRFDGLMPEAQLLSVVSEGKVARRPTVRWDAHQTRDGQATPLRS